VRPTGNLNDRERIMTGILRTGTLKTNHEWHESYECARRAKLGLGCNSRRGAFMIIILVCLMVAGIILGSLLRLALLQSRQLGSEQMRVQAEWLADSGLERAGARLARDGGYAGETWTIEPGRLGGADGAVVVIRVENIQNQASNRSVVVEAVFPAEGPQQARRTRQAKVAVSKES
jgi:Tfp pilus assembly protein PilX